MSAVFCTGGRQQWLFEVARNTCVTILEQPTKNTNRFACM